MSKFTIEYRGKIILNDRGVKDYLRIKKERLPYEIKMQNALTQDGIPFKVAKTNQTHE